MKNTANYRPKLEMIFWFGAFLGLYGLALHFDGHESLDRFFRSHEEYELDEIFTAICIAGGIGFIYSSLRIRDLAREIKKRIAAEQDVDWIACHDALTELPNRRFLDAVCARPQDLKSKFWYAGISIDLDGFKKVNDLLGHDHGDHVLKIVAERLVDIFQEENVYRLGGDEFFVMTRRIGNSDLLALGQRVISSINKPITAGGITADIGASIGITRIPQDCSTVREALRQSDCAMYEAKKSGRNMVKCYDSSMSEDLQKRLQMESELRNAMKEGRISPYYQPLIDLKTRQIVGFEALARWQTLSGKFIPPCEFIPLAETAGLISELTDQLFRMACLDALSWSPDITLSFNISPVQLADRLLGLRLLRIMGEVGLPVHRLEIEVTESAIIQDGETARHVLEGLSEAGIKIALDDFGAGYSSLSQLSNYQFDKIKIDRSFIESFETNDKQDSLVRAIISLGAGLGVKITAEGIEMESQLAKLQELGCDLGQGYLLGRPAPASSLFPENKKSNASS